MVFYIGGQALGYLIDMGTFYVLVAALTLHPILANILAKVCSAVFAYYYHSRVSFAGKKKRSAMTSTFAYILMLGTNVVLTSSLIKLLALITPDHVILTKFVADVIGVVFTFFFMKKLVFPRVASS